MMAPLMVSLRLLHLLLPLLLGSAQDSSYVGVALEAVACRCACFTRHAHERSCKEEGRRNVLMHALMHADPGETVKARLQVQGELGRLKPYRNTMDAIIQVRM